MLFVATASISHLIVIKLLFGHFSMKVLIFVALKVCKGEGEQIDILNLKTSQCNYYAKQKYLGYKKEANQKQQLSKHSYIATYNQKLWYKASYTVEYKVG